jgi:hypothetical protein
MIQGKTDPTTEAMREWQTAYDLFNRELFAGKLPPVMLTLQRHRGNGGSFVYGYHRGRSFLNRRKKGVVVDEIAINPSLVTLFPTRESLQTLAHEMTHLWQRHYGKPSRQCYHNREWAAKMKEIGLKPTDSGREDGKETGQRMLDYPVAGGRFLEVYGRLEREGFDLTWGDARPDPAAFKAAKRAGWLDSPDLPLTSRLIQAGFARLSPAVAGNGGEGAGQAVDGQGGGRISRNGVRVKYHCPGCGVNVWGKPDLNINCGECNLRFLAVSRLGQAVRPEPF